MTPISTIISEVIASMRLVLNTDAPYYEFGRIEYVSNKITERINSKQNPFPLIVLVMDYKETVADGIVKLTAPIIFFNETTVNKTNTQRYTDTFPPLYELIELFKAELGKHPQINTSYPEYSKLDSAYYKGQFNVLNNYTDVVACEFEIEVFQDSTCEEVDTSFNLEVTKTGEGATNPAVGNYTKAKNVITPLYATPASGWSFVNWLVDNVANTSPLIYIKQTGNIVANAVFEMIAGMFTLTITKTGYCDVSPQVGSHQYNDGDIVPVLVTLGDTEQYIESINGDLNPSNPYNITMDANKTVPVIVKPYVQELQVFDRAVVVRNGLGYFGDYAKDNDVLVKNMRVATFGGTATISTPINLSGLSAFKITYILHYTPGTFAGFEQGTVNTNRVTFQLLGTGQMFFVLSNGVYVYASMGFITQGTFVFEFIYNGAGATNADKLVIKMNGVIIPITIVGGNLPTILGTLPSTLSIGRYGTTYQTCRASYFDCENIFKTVMNHGQGAVSYNLYGGANGTVAGAVLATFWGSLINEAIPYIYTLGATLYLNTTDNSIMPICFDTSQVISGFTRIGYFPPASGILKGLPNTYNITGVTGIADGDYTADQIGAFVESEFIDITQDANTVSLLKVRKR